MQRYTLLLLFAGRLAVAQVTVTGPEGDCGFGAFRPIQISHYVERAALVKANPQYPPAAKANGATGTVRVRVLINSRGLVERTCPEYVRSEPRPDRSLVVAAEAEALQWSFSPNFGFQSKLTAGGRLTYAKGVLIFKFVLDEPKIDGSKK